MTRADKIRKISHDTGRYISDYYGDKIRSQAKKLDPATVYMAMLAGTVSTVIGVIEAIEQQNQTLGRTLRDDIAAKVRGLH